MRPYASFFTLYILLFQLGGTQIHRHTSVLFFFAGRGRKRRKNCRKSCDKFIKWIKLMGYQTEMGKGKIFKISKRPKYFTLKLNVFTSAARRTKEKEKEESLIHTEMICSACIWNFYVYIKYVTQRTLFLHFKEKWVVSFVITFSFILFRRAKQCFSLLQKEIEVFVSSFFVFVFREKSVK